MIPQNESDSCLKLSLKFLLKTFISQKSGFDNVELIFIYYSSRCIILILKFTFEQKPGSLREKEFAKEKRFSGRSFKL